MQSIFTDQPAAVEKCLSLCREAAGCLDFVLQEGVGPEAMHLHIIVAHLQTVIDLLTEI